MLFLVEITPMLPRMLPKKSDRQRSFLCLYLIDQFDLEANRWDWQSPTRGSFVSGHHDGRVSNESVELPALAAFFQFQVLLGRSEEHFDVPACRKCGQRLHRQG